MKAAAWRRPSAQGAEFFVAIAAEIQKCDDEPGARARYHVDFNKRNGTFGSKLPQCEKIELRKVFRSSGSFRNYFHDFDVIRNDFAAPSSDIQAAPQDGGEERDHYAALGLQQGAGREEVKSAYHTLARIYHPDKSNGLADVSRFIAAQSAYEALMGK